MKKSLTCIAIIAGLSSIALSRPPQQEGGEERERGGRSVPPIIMALDADEDGVISAEEIAAAADSLALLDENGDGELTREEIRPRRGGKGKCKGKCKGKKKNRSDRE